MRDYGQELEARMAYIRARLAESGAKGIIYGNSGGKDCTLAAILCKRACEDTVGVVMPCASSRNFGEDRDDALDAAVSALPSDDNDIPLLNAAVDQNKLKERSEQRFFEGFVARRRFCDRFYAPDRSRDQRCDYRYLLQVMLCRR